MRLLSAILTLFLVMDPIGNMPLFRELSEGRKERRKTWVVARESFFALLILLVFLFFGPLFMELLHVGQESLYISGGVLLLLISLGMIFPGSGLFGRPPRTRTRRRAVHCALGHPVDCRPFDDGHDHDLQFAARPLWLWVGRPGGGVGFLLGDPAALVPLQPAAGATGAAGPSG